MSKATEMLDELISGLEEKHDVPAVHVHPDAPWAIEFNGLLTPITSMQRCKDCGFLMTYPFETECPVCHFKGSQSCALKMHPLDLHNLSSEGNQRAISRLALRVGQIENAEPHPKSDKLMITTMNIGSSEPITVVAGISQYFSAEELINKRVVVVTNLKHTKLAGVVSQGMILCGTNADQVIPLIPDEAMPVGEYLTIDGTTMNASKTCSRDHFIYVSGYFAIYDEKATIFRKPIDGVTCPLPNNSAFN
ncbi:hypothetical protein PCE1_004777 [Barthelona sp. PCE]